MCLHACDLTVQLCLVTTASCVFSTTAFSVSRTPVQLMIETSIYAHATYSGVQYTSHPPALMSMMPGDPMDTTTIQSRSGAT